MKQDVAIPLGFELGTGEPVEIPLRNLAVTGQTQESGKTTTLEALITRAGVPALVFVTKRGEQSFRRGRRVAPYFRDRADWQFVDQLMEAQLREKNKYLRPWIIRICRNTRTLADVHREVKAALKKAKGLNEGVYTQLDAYLDLIVPEIASVPMVRGLDLQPGLNVMDVSAYQTPMQMLFVQSAIDWVNEHCEQTVVVVPEAWEFVPEGRGSPVKASAISLVRKGSGIGNRIWVDSQDMAGVDKTILRGCPVWIIGVQREANEIKRNLSNIPANIKRPKAADIAGLDRGQFFACWADRTVKVYVQPAWMTAADAQLVAKGGLTPGGAQLLPDLESTTKEDDEMSKADVDALRSELRELTAAVRESIAGRNSLPPAAGQVYDLPPNTGIDEKEALYQHFKARLMAEAPGLLKVLVTKPQLDVVVQRITISTNVETAHGMLAMLISEDFFKETTTGGTAYKEMKRRWNYKANSIRAYEQLAVLVKQGFLTKEGKEGYKAVPGMKVNIVEA